MNTLKKERKGIASRDLVIAILFIGAIVISLSYYLMQSYQEERIKTVYDNFVKKILIENIKK